MSTGTFTGDKKVPLRSPLAEIERRVIVALTPRFPGWIQGYHLTLMTIPWSLGLVVSGWLARNDLSWLYLASAMHIMQWFTDSFDGALGRHRDTGIPKWGYFMDHFLDYVFTCCVLIGYSFFLEDTGRLLVLLLIPVQGAFNVSSYLSFAATGEFKITFLGIGPTELRMVLILINTAITVFGTAWFVSALPTAFVVMIVALCVVVYRTQKYIWKIDMSDKENRGKK
jgi:archaetidylinositol phosphate synthase